jgi:hypothetical protein
MHMLNISPAVTASEQNSLFIVPSLLLSFPTWRGYTGPAQSEWPVFAQPQYGRALSMSIGLWSNIEKQDVAAPG